LEWADSSDDGGSPIVAYTLVEVLENQDDRIVYYGASLTAVVEELGPAGTEFTFMVKSTNLVGDGPWSDQFTFLIVEKPSSPLNPSLTDFDNTFVSLAWQ